MGYHEAVSNDLHVTSFVSMFLSVIGRVLVVCHVAASCTGTSGHAVAWLETCMRLQIWYSVHNLKRCHTSAPASHVHHMTVQVAMLDMTGRLWLSIFSPGPALRCADPLHQTALLSSTNVTLSRDLWIDMAEQCTVTGQLHGLLHSAPLHAAPVLTAQHTSLHCPGHVTGFNDDSYALSDI